MKKSFIALLVLVPVLCFGDDWLVTGVNVYTNTGSLFSNSPVVVTVSKPFPVSELDDFILSRNLTLGFRNVYNSGFQPQIIGTTNSSQAVVYPFKFSDGVNTFYGDWSFAPRTYALFSIVNSLYSSGFTNGIQVLRSTATDLRLNFNIRQVIDSILYGVDTPFKSRVLSLLSSASTSINNIHVDLGQFQNDYSFVNSSHFNISNVIDYAAQDSVIPSRLANSLKSDARDSSNYDYIDSILDSYRAAQWLPLAFSDSDLASPLSNDPRVKQGLQNIGDSFGAGSAGHYITPLTNQMQRMTTDWADETRAALSNNTQKIKDDLAAWKNQLHGTQTSIDNSAANINNTLNNIAGGSSVVRVNVQNQDIGVTITDPVTIDPTQFNAFSEDLGKAGDYMERLFNEFKWWAWDSPDSWKKGFLDRDLSRLSSNVQQQVSVQHSISNLLADFAINYTNNAQFAISNALAGFSFSSTNDYLLLSDYQTFIDSSKYNNVVSSLPDDLAAALSSFGFSDSSEYSGRWWVFQSANMALQSQLALTNAALSSTLLNALSAIDDSDDSGGSLLSRWLSLIDSIPDPEEIQQSLADATNIVSNIGFERADALYSTATQDLVSVVKGIYRDKSLPDNIRFVFIPAAQGREEKFVDIPVGEHSSLWSLFRSGIAFALSVVTLLLFPKYVSWLVSHYTRLVERIIKSLHAYTHK